MVVMEIKLTPEKLGGGGGEVMFTGAQSSVSELILFDPCIPDLIAGHRILTYVHQKGSW